MHLSGLQVARSQRQCEVRQARGPDPGRDRRAARNASASRLRPRVATLPVRIPVAASAVRDVPAGRTPRPSTRGRPHHAIARCTRPQVRRAQPSGAVHAVPLDQDGARRRWVRAGARVGFGVEVVVPVMQCVRCAGHIERSPPRRGARPKYCDRCRVEVYGGSRFTWNATRRARAAVKHAGRRCTKCDARIEGVLAGSPGRPKKYCKACSADVLRSRNGVSKDGASRARKLGLPREAIEPSVVFESARWRCHLCGVRCPAGLRGTIDPRAPEMDHIVPIAAGGGHTWANVALACRACNARKRSRPLGQLPLIDARGQGRGA